MHTRWTGIWYFVGLLVGGLALACSDPSGGVIEDATQAEGGPADGPESQVAMPDVGQWMDFSDAGQTDEDAQNRGPEDEKADGSDGDTEPGDEDGVSSTPCGSDADAGCDRVFVCKEDADCEGVFPVLPPCTVFWCDSDMRICVTEEIPDPLCETRNPPVCDDGNPCTDDAPGEDGNCVYTLNNEVCDDGLACTVDSCDEDGECENTLQSGFCLIDMVCIEDGAANPANACEACVTESSSSVWSGVSGALCDDGDACTIIDLCDSGECSPGDSLLCDDGEDCTDDVCDSEIGCTFSPLPPGSPLGPACNCVVARTVEVGCGRVFAWGDDHVGMSTYDTDTEPFWLNALTWLADSGACGVERTKLLVVNANLHDSLEAFVLDLGFEVHTAFGIPAADVLSTYDIVIYKQLFENADPDAAAIEEWVQAGGALMTLVIGLGDKPAAPNECTATVPLLEPFGLGYDCAVVAPWGPVTTFGPHAIADGLTDIEMPFVNGRWVTADPEVGSHIVARIPGCE